MTNSELSKRNQEFIFHLTKLLNNSKSFNDEKTNSTLITVREKLLAGQKTGKTARQLFGTPSEFYQDLIDPKGAANRRRKLAQQGHKVNNPASTAARPRITQQLFDYGFGIEFIDTSWTLLIMFSALYAITGAIGSSKQSQSIGLITIFLFSLISGAAYVFVLRILTPDPSKKERIPIWQRLLYSLLILVSWLVLFTGVTSLIPVKFNPVLNSLWLFAIAVVAGVSYYFWNKKSSLPRGILIIGSLATNSSVQYRQKYPKIKKAKGKR
ncbi:DUF1129 domain-containing protein [Oenococcus oeni]|uniref:Uncharacterized membrane-bound protein conserved in bacteria n=26 Tax=Oenococcus oeni TaxID=1247 RepID=Q04HF9_OENOB|nr:DUF1129 domain-containing protein [Oenococcus oeni]EAV39776.1 integral membrane protein [Oenococcus oeni ATCC BAA-1163]KGO16375.1 membrane protein [Oenococcus oeni X2L]ABJ56113.1 Uncharacterized membrane-bound protein conserved in bacteria [Oenococcus oeni PSU-1]AWW98679.1 DUF1129 domain-containing protein [Oenococcus oeni]EFD89448.1 hypothetical protein AWRIB429_0096 [Oenococcus oeni AWRIB429]